MHRECCFLRSSWGALVLSAQRGAQEGAAPAPKAQKGSDWNPDDPVRRQALELYENHKCPMPPCRWRRLLPRHPKDVRAHEALVAALLSRADTLSNPVQRKAERVHARNELLRARELGDDSDLSKVLHKLIQLLDKYVVPPAP